ncbi:GAF domain-containing protein [Thermococci archaeon]|nr:MAG: GAF domain-containing protein [Thermococci archaeon]
MSKNKYEEVLMKIEKNLERRENAWKKLERVCELLREIPHYQWVGFYLVRGEELVLGPFSGEPTEHVRIPFGLGVCGRAAKEKRILVVQDVSKESNYLACSPKVKSEIVLPVFKEGEIIGELDIDSHYLSPFSDEDVSFLEVVAREVSDILYSIWRELHGWGKTSNL